MVISRPVLIMAGGTGGHVFPALAVAQALKKRDVPVIWLGCKKGLEATVVPANNIDIEWLTITGIRGKNIFSLVFGVFNFVRACLQALLIMVRVKPKVVLGMGGYVSAPGGVVSQLLGRPLVIHEQNAIPGLTNRLLSKVADLVLEAFPNTFKESVAPLCTGNPVRETINHVESPRIRLKDRTGPIHVLVLGGSLGAKALNEAVPAAVKTIPMSLRPVVRHQCGKTSIDRISQKYKEFGVEANVSSFIEDMAEAYAWADLVVSRAGAMTISEISMVGVASILIPYPYAVDDHQTANAKLLENLDASVMIQQNRLSAEYLGDLISALSVDRERLLSMAENARQLAKPNATESVANQCLALAGVYDAS